MRNSHTHPQITLLLSLTFTILYYDKLMTDRRAFGLSGKVLIINVCNCVAMAAELASALIGLKLL